MDEENEADYKEFLRLLKLEKEDSSSEIINKIFEEQIKNTEKDDK